MIFGLVVVIIGLLISVGLGEVIGMIGVWLNGFKIVGRLEVFSRVDSCLGIVFS